MPRLTRREFLALAAGGTATLAIALAATRRSPLALLEPVDVADPLAAYPTRDWEAIYRDQYRYDSSYTFVCSPNDTHACRLRAFVRNGVVMRTERWRRRPARRFRRRGRRPSSWPGARRTRAPRRGGRAVRRGGSGGGRRRDRPAEADPPPPG